VLHWYTVASALGTVLLLFYLLKCESSFCCPQQKQDAIKAIVEKWTEAGSQCEVDLLLTSGGTGFGLRDTTPETISPLLHRHAPGVAQALLNEGLK
jgi:molybdopterin biosynthesis enzyme MoaB